MQAILIIIFTLLWRLNTAICDHYYNYDLEYGQWYYLRCDIYEVMFLIAMLIPLFKQTLFSKSLLIFSLVLISISAFCKIVLNEHEVTERFYFLIIPLAVSTGYIYYEKRNK